MDETQLASTTGRIEPISRECVISHLGVRYNTKGRVEQPWRYRQGGRSWIVWEEVPMAVPPEVDPGAYGL